MGTARECLLDAADFAEHDSHGPKAATQSLWCMLHKCEAADLLRVFDTLADVCGVSDPISYLGNVLRRMTPLERAEACRLAAERV